jgi:hypothetical protein
MAQLKDEFSKILAEQKEQMIAQFQVPPYLRLNTIPYI